jgi:hypothetical protein
VKPATAFDICHEVYLAAREIVNSHKPTIQLEQVSKFVWRPDIRPRMVEYVADFALAGERALAPSRLILSGSTTWAVASISLLASAWA